MVKVELITNWTILNEKTARRLIDSGLDMLWFSLDGASEKTYADVRLGAELPRILRNLRRFVKMRPANHYPKPELGIAFVVMKCNIADLPTIITILTLIHTPIIMSHVLPGWWGTEVENF